MLRQLRSFCIVTLTVLAQHVLHIPDVTDPLTAIGALSTAINICNSDATTEIRLVDDEPVIILHGFTTASPGGIQGISFGHVVLTNKDPKTHREYDIIQHELAHVKQHSLLGKSYSVLYGLSLTYSYVSTGTYDKNNPLEWGPYHDHSVAWWWQMPDTYEG